MLPRQNRLLLAEPLGFRVVAHQGAGGSCCAAANDAQLKLLIGYIVEFFGSTFHRSAADQNVTFVLNPNTYRCVRQIGICAHIDVILEDRLQQEVRRHL